MYRTSSTTPLVVSPAKVVTAIAFHSEMTAGSLAGASNGLAAALAVPAAVVARSTAAQQANHLRVDRSLVGITANRLMAITPRLLSPPRRGAGRCPPAAERAVVTTTDVVRITPCWR